MLMPERMLLDDGKKLAIVRKQPCIPYHSRGQTMIIWEPRSESDEDEGYVKMLVIKDYFSPIRSDEFSGKFYF